MRIGGVTLRDIAKRAGVSVATVSNVLNGKALVSPETREKVLQVLRELGYSYPHVTSIKGVRNKNNRFITVIGLSMPHFYTQGMRLIAQAVKHRANELEVQVIEYFSDNDPQKQVAQIAEKVTRRVDAVICFPVSSKEIEQGVAQCNRAGIPFISLNRVSSGEVTATVKSDDYQAGHDLGLFTAFYFLKHGSKGKILHLQGDSGDLNAVQRSKGFEETVRQWPNLEIVYQERCYWNVERAREVTERAFRECPEINAIFAESDEMAQAAFQVLKKLGRLFPIGHPEHVLLMGVDGNKFALDAIRKGFYSATAEQMLWEQGCKAVELAVEAVNGNLERGTHIEMPTILVTKENVNFIENHWAERETAHVGLTSVEQI